MSKLLLTAALPYANGSIHLGHMVEHVQADIYARFHRSTGREVLFVCADDTHGTAIELRAEREGLTPEELIDGVWKEHRADFDDFGIAFDHYYTTHSPENRRFSEQIYEALKAGGHLERRVTQQMFSESQGRFLNDRMIKGTCPYCKTPDQYGDVCEACNKTYDPTELIDPWDVVTKTRPVLRETENIYVRLSDFDEFLREWTRSGLPQEAVRRFVDGWLEGGLKDWCISRDAPYFGFPIPGETDKYFYVWLDAPIGYIAATENWAQANGQDWIRWWSPDADTEIVHIIGKDIIYFHTLFWPAMLHAAKLKTPSRVQVHGFLTVNREKMSKSRGTFINARTYLEHLNPEYLRFYYASKLSPGIEDLDLNLEEFVDRVNANLVNNLVNLASRVTKFIEKRFDGKLTPFDPADFPLVAEIGQQLEQVRESYANWEFREAIRGIVAIGNLTNEFFQAQEPWALIKTDEARTHQVCAVALHGITVALTALAPVTPVLAGQFAAALGLDALAWEHTDPAWQAERIQAPEVLLERIDASRIDAMIEDSREETTPEHALNIAEFEPTITFDDFAKVDLRVGVIEQAGPVEGADKLLQLTVHCGKRINVFAGVRASYPDPAVLVGRRVIVVANLQPRKMRFGVSEGMLLAMSGPNDEGLQLVHPDSQALGGWRIR